MRIARWGGRRVRLLVAALASILASLTGSPIATAQAPAAQVKLTPIAENETAHAGSTVRLALEATIAEGLHAQANHPRDPLLIPMQLFIDAPTGVSYVDAAFPAAIEFEIAGEPNPVFTGTFLVGARIVIAKDQPVGSVTIPGRLRYQACNDRQCFPPKTVPVAWTLRVVPSSERVSTQHRETFSHIDFGRAETAPKPDATTAPILSPAPAAAGAAPASDVLKLFDEFEILGTGQYMNTPEFLAFIHDAETGVKSRGPFEGHGPLAILAIVFLGGLALNLTPCVLPMIPINLAIIGAGAQSKKRGRGFVLGAAYGGAMALVYGGLGLVVILTAGTFGAVNSSAWFNGAIAILFVVLGLAMFDVVSLDFSRWSSKIRFGQESRGTFWLAFSMGAVAALLAGACVAPVVIQVVVFASNLYTRGTSLALALPFVLGLGMAIPWPIAGAGLASLPRPGAWMVRVKQVLGVFILATAVYYGYQAYEILSSRWVDPAKVRAGVEAQLRSGWNPSLNDGLQAAQRDRTLVLVDFWATWCKNCLVMDETTLQDPAVKAALAKYTRIKFQAEDLDASPAKELLQRVASPGLPTYVVLRPK
jgi:thiol:disulfide interchange protein DsbD